MRRPLRFIRAVVVLGMMLLLPAGAFAQPEAAMPEAVPPGGFIHTVVEGDTLWDLSAKHLGSPWKWTEIWERNRFLTNPHYIYPGIRIVIVPAGPREVGISMEPPAASPAPEPIAEASQPVPPPAAAPAPAPPQEAYLDIQPSDFVRAGEFVREAPKGVGHIVGGREPKVGFADGDTVYLELGKAVPAGQLLGIYRVRGPMSVPGNRAQSGYVKYLIGVLQVGPVEDGRLTALVRKSFEDLTRNDLVSEEIPSYSRVRIVPGGDGVPSTVIAARMQNKELATGDFVYLDCGSAAGVEVGNVFRVFAPTGIATGTHMARKGDVKTEVARAVVVRVANDYSTVYVDRSVQSFEVGVPVRRGIPAK